MSGDAPIRLALIGCGRIAKTHLDAIAQVPASESSELNCQ